MFGMVGGPSIGIMGRGNVRRMSFSDIASKILSNRLTQQEQMQRIHQQQEMQQYQRPTSSQIREEENSSEYGEEGEGEGEEVGREDMKDEETSSQYSVEEGKIGNIMKNRRRRLSGGVSNEWDSKISELK